MIRKKFVIKNTLFCIVHLFLFDFFEQFSKFQHLDVLLCFIATFLLFFHVSFKAASSSFSTQAENLQFTKFGD